MSRRRKLLGFWIIFILFVFVYPGLYFLLSRSIDDLLGLPRFYWLNTNFFGAVIALGLGLFWVTWAYSYLHFVGRGSPVEAFGTALYPTRFLVTTGPYAYTRNPMVLGLLLILLGVAFAMGSISGLVLVPIFALLAAIYLRRFEEPVLARRFGNAYTRYRSSVPELLPRLHSSRSAHG